MTENVNTSIGYRYWPEAFAPGMYELGSKIAHDDRFYRTFISYLLSTSLDLTQLVHARKHIVYTVQALAPQSNLSSVVWCSLSLATERYFREKSAAYAWSDEECESAMVEWFDLISPAFVITSTVRQLDVSVLRAWKRRFISLHERDVGPLAACEMCCSKCFYSYDVRAFIDPLLTSFDKMRQEEKPAEAVASLAVAIARKYSVHITTDFAFCIAANSIEHQDSVEENQIAFMNQVRDEIFDIIINKEPAEAPPVSS